MSVTHHTRAIRWLIVLVMSAAWMLVTNHCAVAAVAAARDASADACPMHPKPKQKQKDSAAKECCKTLRATPVVAKKLARHSSPAGLMPRFPFAVSTLTARPASTLRIIDTGPPRANSFVESVLQRSILAHAPPA